MAAGLAMLSEWPGKVFSSTDVFAAVFELAAVGKWQRKDSTLLS